MFSLCWCYYYHLHLSVNYLTSTTLHRSVNKITRRMDTGTFIHRGGINQINHDNQTQNQAKGLLLFSVKRPFGFISKTYIVST